MSDNSEKFILDMENAQNETEKKLDDLEKKAEKTSGSIFKRISDAFQKSFKQVTVKTENEMALMERFAEGKLVLENRTQEAIDKLQEEYAEKEHNRRLDSEAENDAQNQEHIFSYKAIMEQKERIEANTYENSAAMRGEYFSMGETEWERYADYIYDICASSVQNLATEEKNALLSVFRDVRSEIERSYESLIKTQEKMEDKLSSHGGLYTNLADETYSKRILYNDISLENMKESEQKLLNYEQYLTEAKEMLYKVFPTSGVSDSVKEKNKEYIKEFFGELADLSVSEGAMFASYLTTLPMNESEEYLLAWAKKQDLAKSIAKKLYSDEQAEIFEESAQSMSMAFEDSLEKHFGSVPSGFYQKGVLSAQGFSDGFIAEMENALADISFSMENIFADAKSYGKGVLQSNVVNNSSYNIYNSQPENTALEIYKYDTLKRMLTSQ